MTAESGQCPSCGRTFPRGGGHCPFDGTKILAIVAPPQDSLAGRVLEDRYQVRDAIATGTIGTSYRGWQMSVSREVVIKVIHPSYASDREAEDRFLHAGGLAAQLVAPAIGNVYDVGRTEDGVMYVVAELVRGRPLGEHIKQRLSLRRSVGIAMQICDALHAAHKLNVAHGDLKPTNLMLDDSTGRDAIKVVDFGLARALDPNLAKPDPRRAAQLYTAPELLDGEPVNTCSDLYALGCLTFEMLVGAPPFTAVTPDGLAAKHRREPPPALPPNVPVPLAAIVQRLLAKQPRDRFQSCADLRAKLEPVLASVGGPATDLPRSGSSSIPPPMRAGGTTTPPSGAHIVRERTPTGAPYVYKDAPTQPSGQYVRPEALTQPTGQSLAPHVPQYRDPTTPPTGPSGPYTPTTPPTGPSNPYVMPPPVAPAPSSGSRRLLVIIIVALITSAAGIATLLAL